MKILIFFLPIVLCIDNYFIINHIEISICGNRTTYVEKVNWYESDNGVLKTWVLLQEK